MLILVHGKNASRSFSLEYARPLWEHGYSLLLFDMRGHGQSDGEHYTYGQSEQYDLVGAANFVKAKGFGPGRIGVIGWSMGGATALMGMSVTPDIRAGVMDSSYGDFPRLAYDRLGILSFFYPGMVLAGKLVLGVAFDQPRPEVAIQNLGGRHVVLIQGEDDVTVPVSEFYALRKAGGAAVADSWLLPGVGHVEAYIRFPVEYMQRVFNFFDRELA